MRKVLEVLVLLIWFTEGRQRPPAVVRLGPFLKEGLRTRQASNEPERFFEMVGKTSPIFAHRNDVAFAVEHVAAFVLGLATNGHCRCIDPKLAPGRSDQLPVLRSFEYDISKPGKGSDNIFEAPGQDAPFLY